MLEFHECAAIFPLLPEAELLELAADIEASGLIEPIVLCDGQILDGRNRYLACIQAKVEPHYEAWRGDDPLAYVVSKNLKRRHLNKEQQEKVMADLRDKGMSYRAIAAATSTPRMQVYRALASSPVLSGTGEIVGLDGKSYPAARPGAARMDVHYSSDRLDWSTPQGFFDKLNREFGFTLDVCATEKSAKCARYFSPDDDGLSQPWTGTCWMNPPYGNEIADWVAKAYHESRAGAIIVCLTPSRTDTAWWHDYLMHADELRFIRGRLRFDGAQAGAPFPSVVSVLRPESAGPPRVSSLECTND